MAPSDLPRADALDRYWDAVQRGEAPPRPEAVDATAAAVIAHLAERQALPDLDAAYQRVRRHLISPVPAPASGRTTPSDPPGSASAAGHRSAARRTAANPILGPAPTTVSSPSRRRWGFAPLATAALLLLTLGLAFVAVGPGRPDPGRIASVPGIAAPTETPLDAAADQTLLDITLPAAELPRSNNVSAGLAHFTVPPGTDSKWTPYCCPGPLIEFVVSGTYAVRAEATIRVVRAGGAVEEVPAGVEVVLGQGDGLVSRNETVVEAANTGSVPVELLSWVVIDDTGFSGHQLPGWGRGNAAVQYALTMPAGSASVRLRRVEMAPDATLPSLPGTYQFGVNLPWNDAGTPLAVETSILRPGTTASPIRNVGPEPVSAYVLTVEAADESSSPMAASPVP